MILMLFPRFPEDEPIEASIGHVVVDEQQPITLMAPPLVSHLDVSHSNCHNTKHNFLKHYPIPDPLLDALIYLSITRCVVVVLAVDKDSREAYS